MPVEACLRSYWDGLASSYAALGSPLRPSSEDVQFMEYAVSAWHARHPGQAPQALLLGVTPDLVRMRWLPGSSLMAVDSAEAMVRAVWPGDLPARRWAVCGDWLSMPRK